MAMRSQVYEWNGGRDTAITTTEEGQQVSIFIGGFGNNITKPAETTATQFVVIEDIACSPWNGGAVQVRINTTDYFQNPDVTDQVGIPGLGSPYPRGAPSTATGTDNVLSSFSLYPDVYVLPGQTWAVIYRVRTAVTGSTSATTTGVAAVSYTHLTLPTILRV